MNVQSNVFALQNFTPGGTTERIVLSVEENLSKIKDGFSGVKKIGLIGWGSQGPAQAQNIRDSLDAIDIELTVGLRSGSSSKEKARAVGFTEENGTLCDMFDVISESDFVIMLISDAGQVEHYERIFELMKPGATIGFSHGFLIGYLETVEYVIREDINIIGLCPKGMGPSVRRLYEQGSGINASFAVHQDVNGKALDYALAWGRSLHAPAMFETTLVMEYRSDIFGERGVLCGGIWGLSEALFALFTRDDIAVDDAYEFAVESLTGPISKTISRHGIKGLAEKVAKQGEQEKEEFFSAYSISYKQCLPILHEIYNEVQSGNEIRSVVQANARIKRFGWSEVDTTYMWKVGREVRERRESLYGYDFIHPTTAGAYAGMMMAQIDTLRENGHCWSEIANESVIEAVDSLNPYMHVDGIARLIDECSVTARLGARKWGPRFDIALRQGLESLDGGVDEELVAAFDDHLVHDALDKCRAHRPTADISVAPK